MSAGLSSAAVQLDVLEARDWTASTPRAAIAAEVAIWTASTWLERIHTEVEATGT